MEVLVKLMNKFSIEILDKFPNEFSEKIQMKFQKEVSVKNCQWNSPEKTLWISRVAPRGILRWNSAKIPSETPADIPSELLEKFTVEV